MPIFRVLALRDLGARNEGARGFELAVQALHVVFEIVGALAVLGFFVVAAAAREVGRRGMNGSGQRAVADAVSVDVFVAGESAEAVEIFLAEHLAAIDRRSGIFEGIGHPVVHAEIEIGHDEDQRLELLGQIERFRRHAEALGHGAGKQHDVLGVAVREERGRENVALRRARGQAGGRADALDVPDDAGDFDVVGESGELRHQRDAGAGGRGHAARARPAGADDHADRGQFVFGLHDGEGRFAVGTDAVFLHVLDHRLHERRRRRDRDTT